MGFDLVIWMKFRVDLASLDFGIAIAPQSAVIAVISICFEGKSTHSLFECWLLAQQEHFCLATRCGEKDHVSVRTEDVLSVSVCT